jgi:hypothetical protein
VIVFCHVVHFVFGHCVGCPSVIVVCLVVHFDKINNMTNNDHTRTTYTMTKKQNEQQDKQRSQKDSLHNDRKQNEQYDKQRPPKDSLHNDQKTKWTTWQTTIIEGQPTQWPKTKWTIWQTTTTEGQPTQWPKNKINNKTNYDHRRKAYTMTKKQNEQHDIVVCHVVHFVFWSLCRLSFCDRCLSCCSFCFLVIV